MRTVFVFPNADLNWVKQRLTAMAREDHGREWFIGAATEPSLTALYVRIDRTSDEAAPLYCDWEPAAMEAVRVALGRLPEWSVVADISGRIPGDEEVWAFVLELLANGGVAVDDYSHHCWTRAEVAENSVVNGLTFFDHRTSLHRGREAGS